MRQGSRLDLAAALVKVARAQATPAPAGLFAALCSGDDLVARVRRLLQPPPVGRSGSRLHRVLLFSALVAGVLVGFGHVARFEIYTMSETVVRLLQ